MPSASSGSSAANSSTSRTTSPRCRANAAGSDASASRAMLSMSAALGARPCPLMRVGIGRDSDTRQARGEAMVDQLSEDARAGALDELDEWDYGEASDALVD